MGKYVELVNVVKVYKWLYGKKYISYYVVKSILVKVNVYICGESENVNKYGYLVNGDIVRYLWSLFGKIWIMS